MAPIGKEKGKVTMGLLDVYRKGLLFSKTFWGALPPLVIGAQELVSAVLDSGALPPHIQPYVLTVSGLLVIVGRYTASKKIEGIL